MKVISRLFSEPVNSIVDCRLLIYTCLSKFWLEKDLISLSKCWTASSVAWTFDSERKGKKLYRRGDSALTSMVSHRNWMPGLPNGSTHWNFGCFSVLEPSFAFSLNSKLSLRQSILSRRWYVICSHVFPVSTGWSRIFLRRGSTLKDYLNLVSCCVVFFGGRACLFICVSFFFSQNTTYFKKLQVISVGWDG